MPKTVTPPRGMRDFLPAEKARRERALAVIRETYRVHGFDEIETPVVEDSDRLHAGLGGDNEKLAFAVMKRGITAEDLEAAAASGDSLALADLGLRFDLTVPLARFYASNRGALPPVFRAVQIAPVWRAERPQKGRYRQFMQCDIDIIGEAGPVAELELLQATLATLDALGLDIAFPERDVEGAHQLVAVERHLAARPLDHHQIAQLNALERRETPAAIWTGAPSPDRHPVFGGARILHLCVFRLTVGTAHIGPLFTNPFVTAYPR